jgi:DNA primase
LATAIKNAQPFLGFRLQRVLNAGSIATPEARSRTAEQAMAVINEHPDMNVRKIYAGEVASHVGIAAADLVKLAERGSRRPEIRTVTPTQSGHKRESAEFVVLALMIQDWNLIASWLNEALFADDVYRRAFLALIATEGELNAALEAADPEAREALERAAVADVESQPDAEAFNLISAAVRRELSHRVKNVDPEQIRVDREARLLLEQMENPAISHDAAEQLLGWLKMCMSEHS